MMSRGFLLILISLLVPWVVPSCGIRIPAPTHATALTKAAGPVGPVGKLQATRDPDVIVWLLADELHTGLVFPYDWLLENGFRPPKHFGGGRFVTMSWGNRQAYVQEAWLTPWQAIRALCWPSPSVMELIPFDSEVVDVCPYQRIYRKLVPRERGADLVAFLNACSSVDQTGSPIRAGKSSWGNGVLLESPHAYHIPRICNVWTLQAMEACGCKVRPWFGMTANGVIKQALRSGNDFEQVWDAYEVDRSSSASPRP